MEEIKVGEYIRTKLGDIKQIREGFEFIIQRHNESSNKIVKHSPNIIDLIEEGDYVNGYKVTEGILYKERKCILFGIDYIVNKENIKSIVTKEQFEQMKYTVGDE